jgi:hypothetical protein
MKKRKKILALSVVVLVLAGIAAWYIYSEYNRVHKDTADLEPDYSISAIQLINEFESDEHASNKKYWNKVIRVKGIVKEVRPDNSGLYSVVLGDTSSMSSVRCNMDSAHNSGATAIQKGTETVMKGICTGFNSDELLGSDVILVRSVVDLNK